MISVKFNHLSFKDEIILKGKFGDYKVICSKEDFISGDYPAFKLTESRLKDYLGRLLGLSFRVQVKEINPDTLIVSKILSDSKLIQKNFLDKKTVFKGSIVKGRITGIYFNKIEVEISGYPVLITKEEFSITPVKFLRDNFSIGEEVEVKITKLVIDSHLMKVVELEASRREVVLAKRIERLRNYHEGDFVFGQVVNLLKDYCDVGLSDGLSVEVPLGVSRLRIGEPVCVQIDELHFYNGTMSGSLIYRPKLNRTQYL